MLKFLETLKSKVKLGKNKKVKIGLALGGGGARGFAHLGAIKAFEDTINNKILKAYVKMQ